MGTKIFSFFIKRWCRQNRWTEPFLEEEECYAFPPNAVIPQRIPVWWNDSYEFGRTIEMSRLGLLAWFMHQYYCYVYFCGTGEELGLSTYPK